jgi:hypothetical protein
VLALPVALSLALAACGSSSSSASKGGTSTTANGSFAARRAAIRACLQKQGINLPQRPPGGGPPRGGGLGGLFGGGGGGPQGQNASKFRAAMQKCGLNFRGRRGRFFSTAAGKRALNAFVACVKKNGYALPTPNTSGNGPVFDPTKVNRNDPKLIVAAAKCQKLLPRPRFRRGGFGPGGPDGGGPAPGSASG